MPYVINNSRNQLIAVVQDGTINTTATSQTLVGKNVTPYGEVEMENLVHQLENFANSTPPENPIVGQLWFDTAANVLNVYTITNVWKPVRGATAAATAPTTNPVVGDLWFDTVARQLKIYDIIGSSARWLPSTKVSVSGTAPAAVIAGELYFNTGLQQLSVFNGSSWIMVGPGVSSVGVIGGSGIAVSGSPVTSSGDITVTNTGVISVTTGNGVSVNQSNGAVIITNTGVTGVTTGSGISTTASNGAITLTNTGVTGLATGNGVSVNQSNGAVIITNTGVTSLATGNGVSVNQANGAVIITNTGVTSLATGNGVSVNQANGAVIITNTGVTGLATGNGVSVNQSNGAVTITNTGVTNVAVGSGISTTAGNGAITLTNTGVTSLATGNGVSVNQSNGAVIITNTGVTRITAGTNITVSPGDGLGNVTISSTASTGGAVLVDSFGAVGDGVTNDSAAFQAAIDSLGIRGGRVLLSADKRYRIGTTITLKPSCHLQGQQVMIGSNGYNFYTDYNAIGSALWIDSTATISMKSGSSISCMLIRQRGMTYVSPSSFAGTAVTILGTSPGAGNQGNTTVVGDDVTIQDCMFLGFDQAISATFAQRVRITQCNIDCVNGILITSSFDVPYINRVHCWPFATIAAVAQGVAPNPNGSALTRTGTAFKFQNTVDWGKITDSFSYGYFRGFWVDNCNSCILTGCGADNVPEAGTAGIVSFTGSRSANVLTVTAIQPGSPPLQIGQLVTGGSLQAGTTITALGTGTGGVGTYFTNTSGTQGSTSLTATGATGFLGFVITGGCTDTILTNCQSASNEKGFYINTGSGLPTQMINCVAWSNRNDAVLIEGGDVTMIGGIFRQSQRGVNNVNNSNRVIIQNSRFSDITTRPVDSASASTYVIGANFQNFSGNSPAVIPTATVTIPSTNSITVNNEGGFFVVSPGAGTGLGNISWGWTGRTICIRFTGNVTVFNRSATPAAGDLFLSGNTNFSASANRTLSLISDGTFWYEVGRS